jgi:hypothetical protein
MAQTPLALKLENPSKTPEPALFDPSFTPGRQGRTIQWLQGYPRP